MIPYDSQDEPDWLLEDLREIASPELRPQLHQSETRIWRETKLRLLE
jgi:hypothetical protein